MMVIVLRMSRPANAVCHRSKHQACVAVPAPASLGTVGVWNSAEAASGRMIGPHRHGEPSFWRDDVFHRTVNGGLHVCLHTTRRARCWHRFSPLGGGVTDTE